MYLKLVLRGLERQFVVCVLAFKSPKFRLQSVLCLNRRHYAPICGNEFILVPHSCLFLEFSVIRDAPRLSRVLGG